MVERPTCAVAPPYVSSPRASATTIMVESTPWTNGAALGLFWGRSVRRYDATTSARSRVFPAFPVGTLRLVVYWYRTWYQVSYTVVSHDTAVPDDCMIMCHFCLHLCLLSLRDLSLERTTLPTTCWSCLSRTPPRTAARWRLSVSTSRPDEAT